MQYSKHEKYGILETWILTEGNASFNFVSRGKN